MSSPEVVVDNRHPFMIRAAACVLAVGSLVGLDASNANAGGESLPKIQPGNVYTVPVAGVGGVSETADQAYLNITATEAEGPGFVSIVDCQNPVPDSSIINYDGGRNSTRANSALVELDQYGNVCFMTNQAPAHILVDVSATDAFPNSLFETPKKPIRIKDTREESMVQKENERRVQVAGVNGVPADAKVVMLNLTATQPEEPGYISSKACNGERATTSSVNFPEPNMNGSTTVIVSLDEEGAFCVGAYQSAVHVIVDVMAWTDNSEKIIEMLSQPERHYDNRPGNRLIAFGKRIIAAAGRKSIPADAGIVFANVTGVSGIPTYMSVGDCDSAAAPNSSLLNLNGGGGFEDAKANGAIVPLDDSGSLCVYGGNGPAGTGVADVIVDIGGFIRRGNEPSNMSTLPTPIRVASSRDGVGGVVTPPAPPIIVVPIIEEKTIYYNPPIRMILPGTNIMGDLLEKYTKTSTMPDLIPTNCFLQFDTPPFDGFGDTVQYYAPIEKCPV